MSDDEFLARFDDLTLPAAEFNHLGHLRLAWLCLRRYDPDEAIRRCCTGIEAYAAHLGARDKFHRTVTEAMVRLLAAAGTQRFTDWESYRAAIPDLVADARASLARHYSAPLLAGDEARRRFVAPDLAPLPL
jgi:hypothetical protein